MKNKRILLLDDGRNLHNAMKQSLTQAGYTVKKIGSVPALLKALKKHLFQAVILDIYLESEMAIGNALSQFEQFFPDKQFDQEAVLAQLGQVLQDPVDGIFLLPLVKMVAGNAELVFLTGNHLRETDRIRLVKAIYKWGPAALVDKMVSDSQEDQLHSGTLQQLLGALKTEKSQNYSTYGHQFPWYRNQPVSSDSHGMISLEEMMALNKGKFSLQHFLDYSVLAFPQEMMVKGEILYFNQKQRLLEQIAQHGFEKTDRTMKLRAVGDHDFENQGICAYAASRAESVLVFNVRYDRRYRQVTEGKDKTMSELVVPLSLGGELKGVLNLEAEVEGAFGNLHLNHFENISRFLALMIEQETFKNEESFLKETFAALSQYSDKEEVLHKTWDAILRLLGPNCMGCILVPIKDRSTGMVNLRVLKNEGLTELKKDYVYRLDDFGVIKKAYQSKDGQAYWPSADNDQYVPLAPDISSEFAICLKKDELPLPLAIFNFESQYSAISERYQRAIKTLGTYVTELLFGMQQRNEAARKGGVQSVINAMGHEIHNARGAFGFLLAELAETIRKEHPDAIEMIKMVQNRLANMRMMLESFSATEQPVKLEKALAGCLKFAQSIKVSLTVEGRMNKSILGTEAGFQWLTENLILNTGKHGPRKEPKRAWIRLRKKQQVMELTYWDNGKAPENLATFWQGKPGRDGIKNVSALCNHYGWKKEVKLHSNGSLCYRFEFPLA